MLRAELHTRVRLARNRGFALFTLSGLFATFGNGLVYITLSWYASTVWGAVSGVALMLFLIWTPSILLGPFCGALADRFNRKTLLIISNGVRGLMIVAVAAISIISGDFFAFPLALVLGIFVSFYMPAALSLVKDLVLQEDLASANASVDMLYEIGTVAGLGFSGISIHWLGIDYTIMIGGVFFLLATLSNFAMPYTRKTIPSEAPYSLKLILTDFLNAFPTLGERLHALRLFLFQVVFMVLLMTVPVVLPSFLREDLGLGSADYAIYEALFSIGVVIGNILSPACSRRFGDKWTLMALTAVLALTVFIFPILEDSALSKVVYFSIGFGMAGWAIILAKTQSLIDNQYQGFFQSIMYSLCGIIVLAIYVIMIIYGNYIKINFIYMIQSLIALLGIFILMFTDFSNIKNS